MATLAPATYPSKTHLHVHPVPPLSSNDNIFSRPKGGFQPIVDPLARGPQRPRNRVIQREVAGVDLLQATLQA